MPPLDPNTGTDLDALFEQAGQQYNVNPLLVKAALMQESSLNPNARGPVTRSGERALGIAQLMPGTAQDLGVSNPFDPTQAIPAAANYLAQGLDIYGNDTTKALMRYHAGQDQSGWGPKTQAYPLLVGGRLARLTGGPAAAPTGNSAIAQLAAAGAAPSIDAMNGSTGPDNRAFLEQAMARPSTAVAQIPPAPSGSPNGIDRLAAVRDAVTPATPGAADMSTIPKAPPGAALSVPGMPSAGNPQMAQATPAIPSDEELLRGLQEVGPLVRSQAASGGNAAIPSPGGQPMATSAPAAARTPWEAAAQQAPPQQQMPAANIEWAQRQSRIYAALGRPVPDYIKEMANMAPGLPNSPEAIRQKAQQEGYGKAEGGLYEKWNQPTPIRRGVIINPADNSIVGVMPELRSEIDPVTHQERIVAVHPMTGQRMGVYQDAPQGAAGAPGAPPPAPTQPAMQQHAPLVPPLAAQPPSSQPALAQPAPSPAAQTPSAATPIITKISPQQLKEEEGRGSILSDEYKKASEDYETGQKALPQLEAIDRSLSNFRTGPTAQSRLAVEKAVQDLGASLNLPVSPEESQRIASGEIISKSGTFLGFTLARSLGSREAASIVQQAVENNPGMKSSEAGNRALVGLIGNGIQRDFDRRNFYDNWWNEKHTYAGAADAFNNAAPVGMYISRINGLEYRPKTPEEAQALPPGSRWVDPQGNIRQRGPSADYARYVGKNGR